MVHKDDFEEAQKEYKQAHLDWNNIPKYEDRVVFKKTVLNKCSDRYHALLKIQ